MNLSAKSEEFKPSNEDAEEIVEDPTVYDPCVDDEPLETPVTSFLRDILHEQKEIEQEPDSAVTFARVKIFMKLLMKLLPENERQVLGSKVLYNFPL
jgi:hypothetical protein